MNYFIAITGKGGVGKTTIAGLIVTRLIAKGHQPVLAVDADPNTCLDITLGVTVQNSVGGIREQARELSGKGQLSGIPKQRLLEMKIAECLVEAEDFDLIAMGRPEGPGCYCYANNVLKSVLEQVVNEYPYVVLDNEAGLENLSRRIVKKVDLLIIVTDPSRGGLNTVARLYDLAKEMDVMYERLVILVNKLKRDNLPDEVRNIKKYTDADFILGLPDDLEIAQLAEDGQSLDGISNENRVVEQIDRFIAEHLHF